MFVATQFYKGGAEVALLNLFRALPQEEYDIDFLILDQIPLKHARSLVPEIPAWVNVCNAAEREGRLAILGKVWFRVMRKLTGRQPSRPAAKAFVRKRRYDAAFSYGEWLSPEFVARRVAAEKKFVWIHTDIDKASYVKENILLGFDSYYDKYIFVSENSRQSAERRFPVLCGRSVTVHNLCEEERLKEAAVQAVDWKQYKGAVLVSVGNLREEKNYPRQLEVMRLLKERGTVLTWLCIGSTANVFLYQKLRRLAKEYGVGEDFHFLGAKENPYCYMARADAVMVLSDYESWSMVITEAKLVGTPVIATPTSGAFEQLADGENGRITASFEPEEIADVIQDYLEDAAAQRRLREHLKGFSTDQEALREFCAVLAGM